MKPLRDYKTAIIVGLGVGIIVAVLKIAVMEVFHISQSSKWFPFVNGIILGSVIAIILTYLNRVGKDK